MVKMESYIKSIERVSKGSKQGESYVNRFDLRKVKERYTGPSQRLIQLLLVMLVLCILIPLVFATWTDSTADRRRAINNGTAGIPLTINGSGTYAASDLDGDGNNEWCYWAMENESYIYYNASPFAINQVANTSENYWFCTDDGTGSVIYGTSNSADTPANLELFMPLDEASGDAIDFASGINATLTDAPTQGSTGQVNKGYTFSAAATNYMTLADSDGELQFESGSQDFSVCFWFKQTDHTFATSQRQFDYRDAAGDGWGLQYVQASDAYTMYLDGLTISCGIIVDDNFHHVCFVIDRDANGQCYLDNVASGAAVGIGGEVMDITITAPTISTRSFDATQNYLNGVLDSLVIFSKALSQAEVTALYNEGANVSSEEIIPVVTGVTGKLKWQIRLYNNDTHYVNSTTGYVGYGDVMTTTYGDTTCTGPSLYAINASELNTTTRYDYERLVNWSAIGVPLNSIEYNLSTYAEDTGIYFKYVVTFYNGQTEVHEESLVNNTGAQSEIYNVTLDNTWFEVDAVDIYAFSLNGSPVSVTNVTLYQSGDLGFCASDSPQYLIYSLTQNPVYVINQTIGIPLWNITTNEDDTSVYLNLNQTYSCMNYFAFYDGNYLYNKSTTGFGTQIALTDYPVKIYNDLDVASSPLEMWHYMSLSGCDPGENFNWTFEWTPVVNGIW